MVYLVTVAVMAGWLPEWEPPLADQSFDRPYAERIKVELEVDEAETLRSVYERAIAALNPRPRPIAGGRVLDAIDTVHWVWFYEPSDESDLNNKYYEQARALVTVDDAGHAQWQREQDEIPLGDLVRAAEYGLVRGDPLKPYLVLQLPQGGGGYQVAWEVLLRTWEVLEGIRVTGEAARFVARLRERLAGRNVVEENKQRFADRGADAFDVMALARATPWRVGDLRTVMGLQTDEDAEKVLRLAGCCEAEDGRFVFSSDDEEAAFMQMAERDVFRRALAGEDLDEHTLRVILETMLRPEDVRP